MSDHSYLLASIDAVGESIKSCKAHLIALQKQRRHSPHNQTSPRRADADRRSAAMPGDPLSLGGTRQGRFRLTGLKFGGGVITRSSQKTDIDATTAVLPGFATVNLFSSYAWKVGGSTLTTQFNVNNLLDKEYFPSSFNRNGIEVGAPRTFMGSVRIEY